MIDIRLAKRWSISVWGRILTQRLWPKENWKVGSLEIGI